MLLLLAVAFGAIAAKLTYVQVVAAGRYAEFGESQLVHEEALPAARGSIFDRNGHELAITVRRPSVWANPRVIDDPAGYAEQLAPILGVERIDVEARLRRDAAFVYLARTVGSDIAERIEALDLPGVHLMDEPKRFSPAGDLAASLLGKVGIDNEGLSGLELLYERLLDGRPGHVVVEQDPAGREIPGGLRERVASIRGDDLVLTIDRSVQHETERSLAEMIVQARAKGGMAIVMESRTGEIVAMANLVADEGGQVRPAPSNTAVTHVYEPGSVNKLITVAAALEEGIVEPETKLAVPDKIRVADHTFSEHDPHPLVDWSITEIMANSSNVGSIMLGQELGKEKIDSYLRAFGFGTRSPLRFPGESPGIMLDPKDWSGTSIGTIPIGQGIAVTAVQMLAAYNTVANDGQYVGPKLVKATIGPDGRARPTPPAARRRVVSPTTARQVRLMLDEVVRAGTGTRAAIDGYTVAGKTGTARKPLEHARGYKPGAYVSSFAGFVPSEAPAFTAIVMLDEPTPIYGGLVAAPVFADITRYSLRQFRVPPPAVRHAPDAGVPAADDPVAAAAPGTLAGRSDTVRDTP